MTINTSDFDEIVLNNPKLKNGRFAYSIETLFWKYLINYDPDSLSYFGQTNSTCKYITLKSYFSDKTIKVIREDNEIKVVEFSEHSKSEKVEDKKTLTKVYKKLIELKKIVKKQTLEYNKSITKITNVKFDIETIESFINFINPKLLKSEKDNLIKELKNAESNPLQYIENLSNITNENSKILSQKIVFNILIDELEKINNLIIVDWKSPFEEVYELFEKIFAKLNISMEDEIMKPKKYDTTNFIGELNEIIRKTEYKMIILGEESDTFLITFTEKENFKEINEKAEKLNLKLNEWN